MFAPIQRLFRRRAVTRTGELRRIAAIPRRDWLDYPDTTLLEFPECFREPAGTMHLRPVQAAALWDLLLHRGLFAPIRVGGGKTLISALAGAVLKAERPVLLVPAKLIGKTQRDLATLAAHWKFPRPGILSYESLGRENHAEDLDRLKPDLIVADEAHKLKNRRAAVTRRVGRYMNAHPGCHFVAMSGTVTTRSIRDFAHIAQWCLPPESLFVPSKWGECQEWADALDEKVDPLQRIAPGALLELGTTVDPAADELTNARKIFRQRMVDTGGVIATEEKGLGVSLSIREVPATLPEHPTIATLLRRLRDTWETPDGEPIMDAVALWRHARELACGFYYVWDPKPPEGWLEARSEWAKFMRDVLRYSRKYDSELQVANAIDRGEYENAALTLADWRAARATYKPTTVPRWVDSGVVDFAAQWMVDHPHTGIVWTDLVAFGQALAKTTGEPFYQKGTGNPIECAAGRTVIASVQSNAEGRNLQAWNENLVISAPPNGAVWEQLLGRTHRDGQDADTVSVDVFFGCREMWAGFCQARADAQYIEHVTGQPQKLNFADVDIPSPSEIGRRWGVRWQ